MPFSFFSILVKVSSSFFIVFCSYFSLWFCYFIEIFPHLVVVGISNFGVVAVNFIIFCFNFGSSLFVITFNSVFWFSNFAFIRQLWDFSSISIPYFLVSARSNSMTYIYDQEDNPAIPNTKHFSLPPVDDVSVRGTSYRRSAEHHWPETGHPSFLFKGWRFYRSSSYKRNYRYGRDKLDKNFDGRFCIANHIESAVGRRPFVTGVKRTWRGFKRRWFWDDTLIRFRTGVRGTKSRGIMGFSYKTYPQSVANWQHYLYNYWLDRILEDRYTNRDLFNMDHTDQTGPGIYLQPKTSSILSNHGSHVFSSSGDYLHVPSLVDSDYQSFQPIVFQPVDFIKSEFVRLNKVKFIGLLPENLYPYDYEPWANCYTWLKNREDEQFKFFEYIGKQKPEKPKIEKRRYRSLFKQDQLDYNYLNHRSWSAYSDYASQYGLNRKRSHSSPMYNDYLSSFSSRVYGNHPSWLNREVEPMGSIEGQFWFDESIQERPPTDKTIRNAKAFYDKFADMPDYNFYYLFLNKAISFTVDALCVAKFEFTFSRLQLSYDVFYCLSLMNFNSFDITVSSIFSFLICFGFILVFSFFVCRVVIFLVIYSKFYFVAFNTFNNIIYRYFIFYSDKTLFYVRYIYSLYAKTYKLFV